MYRIGGMIYDMLREDVDQASRRPEVVAAVQAIYAELQTAIDERKPLCSTSGRCCRFDEFGHRLYVTTIELAAFVATLEMSPSNPDLGGCPFQVSGLCGVHTSRPFGCRVFFCDSTSDAWQHEQYERLHARLKQLHEKYGVPYRYLEWRDALKQLNLIVDGPPRLSLPQLRL